MDIVSALVLAAFLASAPCLLLEIGRRAPGALWEILTDCEAFARRCPSRSGEPPCGPARSVAEDDHDTGAAAA